MTPDKSPKVSIVIIFLNGEKFIQETIESVLAQTYTNWEIMLVDDGSSDNSTIIAQKYADKFPDKIHYLDHPNHQNLGMSVSRNLGSQKASGEYLISMDQDDVLLPHKLERQVAIFEANPEIAMVYGPSLYWYGWTGQKEDLARDHIDKIGVTPEKVYQPPQLMTVYLSGASNGPCTCGMMVHMNILRSIGGWENDFKGSFEHQVFVAKIALNYPVYVEGIPGDKYRQHPDMFTVQTTDREGHYALLYYLQWVHRYIAQIGIKDPDLNFALKKALSFKKLRIIIRNIFPVGVFRYLKTLRKS